MEVQALKEKLHTIRQGLDDFIAEIAMDLDLIESSQKTVEQAVVPGAEDVDEARFQNGLRVMKLAVGHSHGIVNNGAAYYSELCQLIKCLDSDTSV